MLSELRGQNAVQTVRRKWVRKRGRDGVKLKDRNGVRTKKNGFRTERKERDQDRKGRLVSELRG